ncbi:MAG TPA: hypothetical protein VE033_06900 [Acetobacteraceae bacterium]|jgi:hypothetical protein|nr:hypothetical protein [Acetobacteraceae bacterium]
MRIPAFIHLPADVEPAAPSLSARIADGLSARRRRRAERARDSLISLREAGNGRWELAEAIHAAAAQDRWRWRP